MTGGWAPIAPELEFGLMYRSYARPKGRAYVPSHPPYVPLASARAEGRAYVRRAY